MNTPFRCHDADACAMGQNACPTPSICGCAATACSVKDGPYKPAEAVHQIQEPTQAEQEAWFAGLDEGRSQAATAAVAVPDEREGFEKWADSRKEDSIYLASFADGTYINDDTAAAWDAWQARAALSATPAASEQHALFQQACSRINDLLMNDDGQAWKEARKFIEKHTPEIASNAAQQTQGGSNAGIVD